MADSDLSLNVFDTLFGKSDLDQSGVLDGVDNVTVENRDAGTVLSAVLDDHEGLLQIRDNVMAGIYSDHAAVVPRARHLIPLLVDFCPAVASYPCGLSVSARGTDTLPDAVRALSAPAAGDVSLVFVVPSLSCCSCSHFNVSL